MKFNLLKRFLSISTLSLSVCGILLTSSSSVDAQNNYEVISFQSYNFSDRYIRHRNFLGYLEPISDELGRKDATYKLVPGLANSKCSSFESVNFPGHFLRHENFRLKLARRINQRLFREDATFCIKTRLFGDNTSSWSKIRPYGASTFKIRADSIDGIVGEQPVSYPFPNYIDIPLFPPPPPPP